ncbi:conjugal transfer transcriptional regulator TraJ [Ottowia sp.]|jgi:hypothetical protein|uniref:conjugal transfer transcriptional regulator TraJ n=1 Tax=Ottowia sp. TaxID=1898956 RepID=UPI0025CCCB38|nr:conjugal transfer transcriptional regulator TraJ [Ottowia sp.]MBK6612613.1 conjugal transfer transcriptional regulator TraJ [Ottowia sp.]
MKKDKSADEARKATRKNSTHILVPVLPEEKAGIEGMARLTGNSTAGYLRAVGLGYGVKPVLDYERARELCRINGDLGRLGGLLKLWLSSDKRLERFTPEEQAKLVVATLNAIEETQHEMRAVIQKVVRS